MTWDEIAADHEQWLDEYICMWPLHNTMVMKRSQFQGGCVKVAAFHTLAGCNLPTSHT